MSTRPGKLFVVAAPSGAGKTSLVRALLKQDPRLRFSISYTTRARRPTETHTHDYHFVDHATFRQMIANGDFLEHAQVFDNFYGTSKKQVEDILATGANVILEIDWQGAQQIRRAMPECRSIFILPPTREELEKRLRGRGTDNDEVIARRLRDSVSDMTHWNEFDFVVVNDDFGKSLQELASIVEGSGDALKRERPGLRDTIAKLLG